jgi:sugar phosphate isomerase/epimerase
MIRRAADLGGPVVTLCTGTRDPDNMWRPHPDNTSESAWDDLVETLGRLIPAARDAGVRLGIEPEPGNVITDAQAARRLIDDLGTDDEQIGVVLDPANLLTVDSADRQGDILTHTFELLGRWTAAVHAKDVVASGYAAPGVGVMDYDLVFRLHAQLPTPVPVIAQDLTADDAERVRRFLGDHAEKVSR